MHTYESYSKEEIMEFLETKKPSFWKTDIRINPENMRIIYILKWR